MHKKIYDLSATTMQGKDVSFERYRGKVLLIVNIATQCGQAPQLEKLEAVYQKYKSKGLEIIAFPSNDFAQEPRSGNDISEFCAVNYGVTFQVYQKIHVKGSEAHPIFKFLNDKKANGKFAARPYWNFYKYLFDRDGNALDYFITYTKPGARRFIRKIEKALLMPASV